MMTLECVSFLKAMDVDAPRAWLLDMCGGMPPGVPRPSNDTLVMAMHKARYHHFDMDAELRHTSAQWLRDRNFKDIVGMDALPEGQLPEIDMNQEIKGQPHA